MYDYLIVGAGLFGAVFAHQMTAAGKKCLVVEKRPHIGGNVYTQTIEGIDVHVYGAHIFHTGTPHVWDFIRQFADFNHFINAPIANYHGKLYNLPFNMNTFYQRWGVATPAQAQAKIAAQQTAANPDPANLEEQAIKLVGQDLYEVLVKGYSEKQWGRPCKDLPPWIIDRLPLRFTFDNNYYTDPYQGIPVGGYTAIIEKMLQGSDVRLGVDYTLHRAELNALASHIVYTGPVDAYFDHALGRLQYRSLRFETETLDTPNHQGVAVMHYTDAETPYTRIIEHKHFAFGTQEKTVITREYSVDYCQSGTEPYYPINDTANDALYARYADLATRESNVLFGGRLAEYRYYDMDDVIRRALDAAEKARCDV